MILQHVVLLKSQVRSFGGLEKSASRIAKAFVERGARVSVLTSGSNSGLEERGISVHAAKTAAWPAFLRMEHFDRFVRTWLRENPADLVFGMDRNRFQTHFRAGNGVHEAYLKSRILTEGKWKYYSCLLNPMHRKILDIEKKAFENPSLKKLFTNSHMVKRQILEKFSTDPAKIQVVHNGVEWQEMEADFTAWPEKKLHTLRDFFLPADKFHLLFIGNGYLRKGLLQLLEGLARLNNPDVHLSVIGKESHLDVYQTAAYKLGLIKRVHFFGPRTDIRPFYQYADALAIPSFYDPFANVTVEALAMGLFVISSKFNGGSEILTAPSSISSGIVIEELQCPDSIASALREAIRHPKTIESAFKRRLLVERLDFSHQMKSLIEACCE
jgi:UDP-glucose:(heptosyl)LPS alpha-1,3-glucosyltransferase